MDLMGSCNQQDRGPPRTTEAHRPGVPVWPPVWLKSPGVAEPEPLPERSDQSKSLGSGQVQTTTAQAMSEVPSAAACDRSVDSTEAVRLLAEVRAEAARVQDGFAGECPETLRTLLRDAVALAEGYVANQELERARGWDPLELLRSLPGQIRRCGANARRFQEAASRKTSHPSRRRIRR
jgi:hypothetical protein